MDFKIDFHEALFNLGTAGTSKAMEAFCNERAEYYASKGMILESKLFRERAQEFRDLTKDFEGYGSSEDFPSESPN